MFDSTARERWSSRSCATGVSHAPRAAVLDVPLAHIWSFEDGRWWGFAGSSTPRAGTVRSAQVDMSVSGLRQFPVARFSGDPV
jgi:hypothetical protein